MPDAYRTIVADPPWDHSDGTGAKVSVGYGNTRRPMDGPSVVTSPFVNASEILNAAADLIEPDGAWTQRAGARTSDNGFCDTTDPEAVAFCATGAIYRVSRTALGFDYPTYCKAVDALESQIDRATIARWNDWPDRTQAEVVEALRKAAAKA